MTDVPEFSEWEHLQSVVRMTFTRLVRDTFQDGIETDISTPEGSLKYAMLPKDADTTAMTNLRILLYLLYRGEVRTPSVYGIPIDTYESEIRYKPQIKLHFQQTYDQVPAGFRAVEGDLSIRLVNETSTSITQSDVNTYAQRIKNVFGTPQYIWKKGKNKYTYKDEEKGYDFRILSVSETEAKELIGKLLDIVNEPPDWKWFTPHIPESPMIKYPENPGSQTILGKAVRKPRQRPIANTKFRYANLYIYGLANPITLYDATGVRPNPILN